MRKERLIIIGGVEAGLGAATQARRLNPDMEIIVFEKTEFISYGLCGMSYFIGGDIPDYNNLIIYKPSYFKNNRNIDVQIKKEVIDVNSKEKYVIVKDLENGGKEEKVEYDKLVIGTGARARKLNIEGSDLKNIFTFRDLKSAIEIKEVIKNEKPKNAVVIGSGFIGLTMVEAFVKNGIKTTLIEKEDHILPSFSNDMSNLVLKELKAHNVEILTGVSVDAFLGNEKVEKVSVNGKFIEADIVLISVGVIPNIEIAESAGCEILNINGIKVIRVNNKMQTSVPHIYAAGDCTHTFHYITGKEKYLPLATITDKQAQIAANNICGKSSIYKGTVGSYVERVFNLEIARTGLTEKELIENGFKYDEKVVKSRTRAGYYPGGDRITLKVFTECGSNRILGAELIGGEFVAKRIDILGLAIFNNMKLSDLYHIDFAYTPPVAPSRDILWIASVK